ncbi:hypothetical protein JB92DRAFT_3280382 [Gautieria morchelliformis]|nr:hypothetical protein JB92DRAFT_3280382 [Gautieria morchelliformis]
MDLESNVTTTQNTALLLQKSSDPPSGISLDWLDEPILRPPRIKGRAAPERHQMAGKNMSRHTLSQIIRYVWMGYTSIGQDNDDGQSTSIRCKNPGTPGQKERDHRQNTEGGYVASSQERPDVVIREGDPVSVEELNVPAHFSKGGVYKNPRGYKRPGEAERTSRVWALVTLLEAMPILSSTRGVPQGGDSYWSPSMGVTRRSVVQNRKNPCDNKRTDVRQAIEDNVGPRQAEVLSVHKSADKGGQIVWNIRLTFKRKTVTRDDGSKDSVVDTLGKSDRTVESRTGRMADLAGTTLHRLPWSRTHRWTGDSLPEEADNWPIEVYLKANL